MINAKHELPVVFLMGPTASGKTQLAVELCQHLPFEIISVDSALVYRGMDIGTAKPDAEVLSKAPHRLIDICDPADAYSAGSFREDALEEINEIHQQNKIPLLVGGTGLYFRALERGIADLPSADAALREKLTKQAEASDWQSMHERLRQIDPESAERIHQNDPQRIQRALEVYELSGKPLSSFFKEENKRKLTFTSRKIVIAPSERSVLHERIRRRFEQMMEFGLINEVEQLYQRGDLSLENPSMRIVGYRQVWQYLAGELAKDDIIEKAVVATRQLAKRQLTWLRSEQQTQWFDSLQDDLEAKALRFLTDDPILSRRV